MVFKKPYAFLIKHFKFIHILVTVSIIYLMIKTEHIIAFLNEYIHSNNSVIGQNIVGTLYNPLLYILPILIIIFSIVLFLVMNKKEKPKTFYIISIIIYVISFAIYLYGSITLNKMEDVIVDMRTVTALYDLFMFIMIFQGVSVVIYFIRGIGFDIKKFDFGKDLQELDISQTDSEEFEVDFDFDFNDSVRKYKKQLRHIRYIYKENKFIINICLGFVFALFCFYLYNNVNIFTKTNKQGVSFSVNGFTIGIMDTYLVNTDKQGKIINEDSYLLVANVQVKNDYREKRAFAPGSIELKINNETYHHTTEYKEYLTDLGVVYENNELDGEFVNYLLVYEIPKNMKNKRMKISIANTNNHKNIYVRVKYKDFTKKLEEEKFILGEEVTFSDTNLKNTTLTINDYQIEDRFIIDYLYCIKNGRCVNSKEYLRPTYGDVNYDESLLKLKIDFNLDEESNAYKISDFYSIFNNFVAIKYEINGKEKSQSSNFKQVKSSHKKENNVYYIEVNSEIKDAQNINIQFNIRNKVYNYYLN